MTSCTIFTKFIALLCENMIKPAFAANKIDERFPESQFF